jgi:hypothetical protein
MSIFSFAGRRRQTKSIDAGAFTKSKLQQAVIPASKVQVFCPSPSPDGQKEIELRVLCVSVVKNITANTSL